MEGGSHYHVAASATFGAAKGALKPNTNEFKKKSTGNPILIEKEKSKIFFYIYSCKKDEKPIHGLVSDKNFIVANAVENILAAPKLP